MKKLNKFMLLLAAAVFTLTACEKELQREPSPTTGTNVVAFKDSKISVEINPVKAPLQYGLTIVRSNADSALVAGINVVEGNNTIIKVPATVSFAAGEKEAALLLTFPNAELDSTYNIVLEIAQENATPYLDGASQCSFTVTIATWEPVNTKAIVFDGLVISFFGVEKVGWYVNYLRKDNADGSFDIRLLNPYAGVAKTTDQFGISDNYPYNEAGDIKAGTFNWDIHIAADGTATFDEFEMGIDYGYGMFSAQYYDPEVPGAVWDATTNCVTFPAKSSAVFMADYGGRLTSESIIIYLDAVAYQNDHISIDDFNSGDIEWEEQESEVNLFESSIFSFSNDEQKLFKAVDPLVGNEKSPYINLYCLKDVYVEGANLAFYWNGEDGDIDIPANQDLKISFMGQELYVAAAAGSVETVNVKGTDVKVFTFNLLIVSDKGNEVGVFKETFSMANEPIVFAREDFIGNFTLDGYSQFTGEAESLDVIIAEEEGELVLHGIDYCSGLHADFNAETGVLSIAPQTQDTIYGQYDITFYTTTAAGASGKAVLQFAYGLDGVAKLTKDCEADGYLVRSEVAGGWLAGLYDVTLTPAAPAAAPAKTPVFNGVRDLKKHTFKSSATPRVDHLSFKGQYHRERELKN